MDKNELKNWINSELLNKRGNLNSRRLSKDRFETNYPTQLKQIKQLTTFLSDDVLISERLCCIINNFKQRPVCLYCGDSDIKFISFAKGFQLFCCKECTSKSPLPWETRRQNDKQRWNQGTFKSIGGYTHLTNLQDLTKEYVEKHFLTSFGEIKKEEFHKHFNYKISGIWRVLRSLGIEYKSRRVNQTHITNFENFNKEYIETHFLTSSREIKTEEFAQYFNFKRSAIKYTFTKFGIKHLFRYANQSHLTNFKDLNKEYVQKHFVTESGKVKSYEFCKYFNYVDGKAIRALKKLGVEYYNSGSYAENQIYNQIKEQFPSAISNSRSIIKPLELDIYIPEKKVAIEYNGMYWHSVIKNKNKNYHQNKTLLCKEKGVDLIHIFENEWKTRPDIVLSMIFHKLGTYKEMYNVNYCNVKEIDINTKDKFLNANNLQGAIESDINLGLFNGNNLLSVMLFKQNKSKFELLKYCVKINTQVKDGSVKLINYFKEHYRYSNINVKVDLRYDVSDQYKKLNLKLKNTTKPEFWYLHDEDCRNLYQGKQFKMNKIQDNLKVFDKKLTDQINMFNNDYYKIWDCGSHVMELG